MLTNRPANLKLGCTAKDTISGFSGTVVAITEWLNGCQRVTIQPREMKDGKPIEPHTFDAEQIEVVEPATPRPAGLGGPPISPVGRPDPVR
jgi:hypothetical protein